MKTYPLNKIKYTAEDAQVYLSTREKGIYSSEADFKLSITGARTISIAPGLAWLKPKRFGGFYALLETPQDLTVALSEPELPRWDLIKIRYSKVDNGTNLVIVKGVPGSKPIIPDVIQSEAVFELGLYAIYVPTASTVVNQRDIKSLLLDEHYCGVMRDGVTGIPTAQIQKQAEDMIAQLGKDAETYLAQLRQTIDNIAAGTDTMLQTVFNKSGRKEQVAFERDLNNYNNDFLICIGLPNNILSSIDPKTGEVKKAVVGLIRPILAGMIETEIIWDSNDLRQVLKKKITQRGVINNIFARVSMGTDEDNKSLHDFLLGRVPSASLDTIMGTFGGASSGSVLTPDRVNFTDVTYKGTYWDGKNIYDMSVYLNFESAGNKDKIILKQRKG